MRKILLTFSRRPAWLAAILLLSTRAAFGADAKLLDVTAVNVSDILGNVRGGLAQGARVLDRADLTATFLGDEHGAPGLSFFLDVQATDATDFTSALVGNIQSVSSLDGPAGVRIADAWVARDFGGQAGLKAGIVDLNSEFDVQTTASLFLNSAFGIGPDFSQSGQNGPSIFPSTGLGLVGWWLPGDHWQLKAGVFEDVPGDPAHPGRTDLDLANDHGALLVAEVRNHVTPDFVLGVGTWRYTAAFDPIIAAASPHPVSGNSGLYAIADGLLYADPEGEKTGLSGWVRVGFANDRINMLDAVIGGGLVYTGPFGRLGDQLGLSVSRAQLGAPARLAAAAAGAPLHATETAVEATYSFAVSDRLTVQPDLQYVFSPSSDPALGDALIIGSRVTLTW